jgi:hypothetical protein
MAAKARSSRVSIGPGTLPADLYAYADTKPWPRSGRPAKHDIRDWTISDNWPEYVPVTDREIGVFEAWFGDVFDKLFGARP